MLHAPAVAEAAPHLLKAKSSSDTLYSLRLGLIIRLGGLEIHKRPWQRFSKRLSPHTRMLTNCGSRVSVSQLSSPLMYLYLNRQLGSQINRLGNVEKIVKQLTAVKKIKRKLLNCAILPIAKSLNWAWRGKEAARERGGNLVDMVLMSTETMATSLALENSSHRQQRQCISICICISRDTFSHAFQLQTR